MYELGKCSQARHSPVQNERALVGFTGGMASEWYIGLLLYCMYSVEGALVLGVGDYCNRGALTVITELQW